MNPATTDFRASMLSRLRRAEFSCADLATVDRIACRVWQVALGSLDEPSLQWGDPTGLVDFYATVETFNAVQTLVSSARLQFLTAHDPSISASRAPDDIAREGFGDLDSQAILFRAILERLGLSSRRADVTCPNQPPRVGAEVLLGRRGRVPTWRYFDFTSRRFFLDARQSPDPPVSLDGLLSLLSLEEVRRATPSTPVANNASKLLTSGSIEGGASGLCFGLTPTDTAEGTLDLPP